MSVNFDPDYIKFSSGEFDILKKILELFFLTFDESDYPAEVDYAKYVLRHLNEFEK